MGWGNEKVIISLVIVMLLVALTLSIKSLYDNIHTNYKGSNQSAQNEKFKQEKKTKYKLPKINVLSQQFSENFMNSDVRNHYMHISKGMDKHKVETYFGDSEKTIQIANMKAHKYGDMAFYSKIIKFNEFLLYLIMLLLNHFRKYMVIEYTIITMVR